MTVTNLIIRVLEQEKLPLIEMLHALLPPHQLNLQELYSSHKTQLKSTELTIVLNLAPVSSLLSKNLPHPSKSSATLSTFTPEKLSRQTLNMWRIRCEGTTRNFVNTDTKVMF